MHTKEILSMRQKYPLELKIAMTKVRIRQWYEEFQGDVYVSFSGGKDSTVLLHIARSIYPDIEAVFVDTGLEYPEIRSFVKNFNNVTWLKPKMKIKEVVKTYGWNFPSKDVAQCIYYARKGSKWALEKISGNNKDGTSSQFKKRYSKFKYLIDAPFLVSAKCCEIMKENPLRDYEKESQKKPIIATMAEESQRRQDAWLKTGCNALDTKIKMSKPMSFWTEQDILHYIKLARIQYCSVYGEIVEKEEIQGQLSLDGIASGDLVTTGEQRTGCMFCPVGCHLDHPNKYERMKLTHPKQYDYCIREENGLGLGKVLDYIGVNY